MDLAALLAHDYAYAGMIITAIVANLFPGVPEEILLLSLGYLAARNDVSFILTALMIIIGLIMADSFLYYLARRGSRITSFILRKLIGEYDDTEAGFLRTHIDKIIFISRFLGVVRSIGPILAGTLRYDYKKFMKTNILALILYVPLLLGLGHYFEDRVALIIAGTNDITQYIYIILMVVGLIIIMRLLARWFKHMISPTNIRAWRERFEKLDVTKWLDNDTDNSQTKNNTSE